MSSKSEAGEQQMSPVDKLHPGALAALIFIIMTPLAMTLVAMTLGPGSEHRSAMEMRAHAPDIGVQWIGEGQVPEVRLALTADSVDGWNLHVQADGFRFAPEHVGKAHADGEGHGHIYVDGEKVARLYGPWIHLGELPDDAELIVMLSTNDHRHYVADDEPLYGDARIPSR